MSDDEPKLGAYAPPPEDYETFDAREGETERRGPILLFAAVAVLVLFAALVWNAYRLGVRERDAAPVILADEQPYRQRPADPGGYETPGQDIEAYPLREPAPAEPEAEEESGTAGLRPGPEEPVATPPQPSQTELPEVRIETVDADAVDEPAGEAEAADPDREPARSEPAPRQEETPPQPAAEPRGEPADIAPAAVTGDWVVQIAAFRTRAEAEEAWIGFTSRYPDLARNRAPSIVEADLGERGIWYRLRIAAFESRQAATNYCSTLSARGQDCLVASR